MDVSIIIVNYNTRDLLENCIDSVIEQTRGISYEILISDNGSLDGSKSLLEEKKYASRENIRMILNGKNIGFGAANNRALKEATGRYIFYLNSDTVLLNNAVKLFFDYWEQHGGQERLGCLGCQLLSPSGEPIHSFGRFPTPNGVLKALVHMWLVARSGRPAASSGTGRGLDADCEIDGYITGADMFLLNEESAAFDERFFMYAEEADLQYNAFYRQGKKRVLLKEPRIVHFEGASDKSRGEGTKAYSFAKRSTAMLWVSSLIYIRKNYPAAKLQFTVCRWMLKKIWMGERDQNDVEEYLGWLQKIV